MSTTTTATFTRDIDLGLAVPPFTPHAISVSLPKWKDNVDYELGAKRVANVMVSGYPRFFIHLDIRKLEQKCLQKFGVKGESCMLFPTAKTAGYCRDFILNRSALEGTPYTARIVSLTICPEDKPTVGEENEHEQSLMSASVNIHIVLYPAEAQSVAKQFWQHSGLGISSRLADHCLALLPTESPQASSPVLRYAGKVPNKHYAKLSGQLSPTLLADNLTNAQSEYLEERYGRNLPISAGASAKRALRRRISQVLVHDNDVEGDGAPKAGAENLALRTSTRDVPVSEDDVFLYPAGMAAIWSAHNLIQSVRPDGKSVCFGFPYTDTLKILQKWGPGCYFLGHGLDFDIDELERILEENSVQDPTKPPILALFTEFPSNPLLRSADLPRLRALADKYDFLIVIDDTVGNFMNVEVLGYADIVVSSLTKIFSGDANVMGGGLVLNPKRRHYQALKSYLDTNFEDLYFEQDAIYLERNSRNFEARIRIIDQNTEAICDFLHARSIAGGDSNSVIKEVFYPKYITRRHYETCRIKGDPATGKPGGGFGGLFSVTFTSEKASHAFFDTLECFKGPSLGTNFTLASPFVILAHFTELEWAAKYDVEACLVRVGVGLEDISTLLACFEKSLNAATAAVQTIA